LSRPQLRTGATASLVRHRRMLVDVRWTPRRVRSRLDLGAHLGQLRRRPPATCGEGRAALALTWQSGCCRFCNMAVLLEVRGLRRRRRASSPTEVGST